MSTDPNPTEPVLAVPTENDSAPAGWSLGILVVALVVGLLRFVRLGQWSLWIDEVYTWGDSQGAALGATKLGYLVIGWTVDALGGVPTEAALRLAPAVLGYLAIPLTFWAFHPIAGRSRAAGAALVIAVSAWEIQWAQTARFYTMVQALGLVGAGVMLRGVLASRWIVAVLGISIAGLGVLFHLSGALLAAALGTAACLIPPASDPASKRAVRRAFLVFALPGLLALPFVWSVWQTYLSKKGISDPLSGVGHFALSTGSFVTPTLAAMALGSWCLVLRNRDRAGAFTGSVPVLGGVVLALLAATATVSAQYAFAFFPWIALLASWPLGLAQGRRPGLAGPWLLALTVPLLAQTTLYFTVENGQRPRWREAIELVAARRSPSDVVVAAPAPVVEFYLTGARETDVRHHDSVVQLNRFSPRPYDAIVAEGRTAWFVVRNDYSLRMTRSDRRNLKRFLSERCRLVEHFPVLVSARDLSVTVWRFDPPR